jgi:hypothetical protein
LLDLFGCWIAVVVGLLLLDCCCWICLVCI